MRFLIALLAGAASVFAFAPFGVSPLAFVSLAALWWLLEDGCSRRRAAAIGFAWGIGAFAAGLSWLYIALHTYAGMPVLLACLALLLFCAYLAIYPALACALYVWLRRANPWANSLLVAAAWTAGEMLRGWVLTGFPWLAIGYTQTPPSPLAGWAPIFGAYGVGFLVAFIAALATIMLKAWFGRQPGAGQSLRPVFAPGLLALAVLLSGAWLRGVPWTHPLGQPLDVALLQTNIPQDLKWQPEQLLRWLELNYALVHKQQAQLVVLPETSLPLLVEQLPQGYMEAMKQTVLPRGGNLIVGVFTREDQKIYNSAVSTGSAPAQHYSKHHLVPFGEYSPPLFGWFYTLASIPMSDQTPGAAHQAPLQIAGQRIAINICYEDIFGDELLPALPEATLMLNLSNLAWYGDYHAQPQHLQIARMRALETGRPMLRSTNTGMTAIVQPDGSVTGVLPAFQTGALRQSVQGYTGSTPYSRWANWPVMMIVLGFLGYGGFRSARRPMPAK